MTVVQAGEVTFLPRHLRFCRPAETCCRQTGCQKEEAKPSNKKFVFGALGIAAFGWAAAVAPCRLSIPPSPSSSWPAWSVTYVGGTSHALHTPLMSVTNAISGIIVVGALLQIGQGSTLVTVLAFVAVLIASINIFGGFTVTSAC